MIHFLLGGHGRDLQSNLTGGTFSNVYLIVNDGEGCLIDTGITGKYRSWIEGIIEENNCELKYIILTHDHFDHVGNVAELKENFGGKIVAHKLDVPMIENPTLLFSEEAETVFPGWSKENLLRDLNMDETTWMDYHDIIENYIYYPQEVDIEVEEGDILEVGGISLTIYHTPGHSPGSISILDNLTRSLFVGDLPLGPGRPSPIGNFMKYEKSLLKIKEIDKGVLGLGHSTPITGKYRIRRFVLRRLTDFYHQENIIIYLLDSQPMTVEEISDFLYPAYKRNREYPNKDFATHCHLLKLADEKIVERLEEKGRILWKKVNKNVETM
jgi:glyoxylase-like metal-dependent hydrolase (beta-lactamase superfamily II)